MRPSDVVRSVLFYIFFYLGSAIYVPCALATIPFSKKVYRRAAEGWSGFHRLCVRWLLGIKVVVQGDLPMKDTLVAMKHESFFEAIDMPNMLENPAIFAKAELLRIPLWGRAGSAYGLIAVEREGGAKALRKMISAAKAHYQSGRVLAIFPEGTRVPHGKIAPLQSGFSGLYKLLGLPVVPIAVDSGTLYHRRWKRAGTITVVVGEAIPPGLPRAEIEAQVISAINVLNTAGQDSLA